MPKALLAGMAAAVLAPIAAPLLAGKALEAVFGEFAKSLSGLVASAGKSKIEEFLKDFLKKNRGRSVPPGLLEQELSAELEQRLAEDSEEGVAFRRELAQVLDGIGAIQVAIENASDEIREDIALAFGDLAAQYEELKALLTDVAAGLELVMETQSHQLALQLEQLEIQRITASKLTLLISHVEQPRPAPPVLTGAVTGGVGGGAATGEGGPGTTSAPPPAAIESPYPGLLAFQADDADRFFGRDALVADLVTRVASQSLVAVIGPSGSGKSSVVRAGLLPRIGTRALPGSVSWPPPIVMAPGRRPLEQLAIRLGSRRPGHDGTAVYRTLLDQPGAIRIVVGEMLDDSQELVIVVDQFEEIFTQCDDERERAAFVACLVDGTAERSQLRVVLSLRADYIGACTAFPDLLARLQDSQVLVGPMTETELREAVVGPAAQVGVAVEERLVDLIVADVHGEPGALPLLSHALAASWERREGNRLTVAGYLDAGGVRGAIAKTADEIVAAQAPADQALTRSVMLRLTNTTGDVPTRQRVAHDDLVTLGSDPAAVERVLRQLTAARILTATESGVQVAHEAVLREWGRLRDWIEEDRRGLATRQLITQQAARWDESGRSDDDLLRGARLASAVDYRDRAAADLTEFEELFVAESLRFQDQEREEDRRRARRFRRLAIAGSAVGALAAALAVFAFFERGRAEDQTERAEAAEHLSEARRLAAESAAVEQQNPSLSALLALEADRQGPGLAEPRRRLAALGTASLPRRVEYGGLASASGVGVAADGSVVALGSKGANEPALVVWDAAGEEPAASFDVSGQGFAMAHRGSVAHLAEPGLVRHVDLETGEVRDQSLAGVVAGQVPRLSPAGTRAFAAGADGLLHIWDTDSGEALRPLSTGPQGFAASAVSDHMDLVALTDQNGYTLVEGEEGVRWSVFTGRNVFAVAFSPDAALLALATEFGTLVYDAATGQFVSRTIPAGNDVGSVIAFSEDSTALVIASAGEVSRWRARTSLAIGSPARLGVALLAGVRFGESLDDVLIGTFGGVVGLDFGANSEQVLLERGTELAVAAFSADGGVTARFEPGRGLVVRRAGAEREQVIPYDESLGFAEVTISDDGRRLAASSGDELWLFDLESGRGGPVDVEFDGTALRPVRFSHDGERVAVGVSQLGDATAGVAITVISFETEQVEWSVPRNVAYGGVLTGALAWSPDDGEIAVSHLLGKVEFLDAGSGEVTGDLAILAGTPDDLATTLVYGPETLAVGYFSGRAGIFDLGSGEVRHELDRVEGARYLTSLAYDEGSGSLVAASLQGQIVGWEAPSRLPLFGPISVQENQSGALLLVGFTPGAESLLVSDFGGGLRRIAWGVDAWRSQLCAAAGRNMTQTEWDTFLPGQPYRPTCAQFPAGE